MGALPLHDLDTIPSNPLDATTEATEMTDSTRKPVLVAEIDADELTVRLLEIGIHLNRPVGKSAKGVMLDMDASVRSGAIPAYIVNDFKKMAVAAIEYFGECMKAARNVQ